MILFHALLVAVIISVGYGFNENFPDADEAGGIIFSTGLLILAVHGLYLSGSIFNNEIYENTFQTLTLLPLSISQIVRKKILASLIIMTPTALTTLASLLLIGSSRIYSALSDSAFYKILWVSVSGYICFYVMTAFLSLYIRHGALAVAGFLYMIFTIVLAVSSDGSAFVITLFNITFISIFCHLLLIRLRSLAGNTGSSL
jgi:hypothetical protein